jgi:uncharacterized protein with HEPN domain
MRDRLEKDLFHIEIMIERFSRIDEYSKRYASLGIDLKDEMVLDSLSFQFDQAGDQLALGKLSKELQEEFSNVNWKRIRDGRNFISHSYVRKNNAILMKIFYKDVPIYIDQLYNIRHHLLKQIQHNED